MPAPLQPVLPLPQDPSAQLVVLPSEPATHPASHLGMYHHVFYLTAKKCFSYLVFLSCVQSLVSGDVYKKLSEFLVICQ